MAKYIICYDIIDRKRLLKVHTFLKKIALPIQYSIFILECDSNAKINYLNEIKNLIDHKHDDLRCYIISNNLYQIRIGKAVFSEGIYFSNFPAGY